MQHFEYSDSPYPIRESLVIAYRKFWDALASPGTWYTGAQRIAIAAEVRNAVECPFCQERKAALSPYSVEGEHLCGDTLDAPLDARVVDAVHRVITDQSRITASYINDNTANGLSEEAYIELVGVAVTVFSLDEFNRGLGLPPEPLPAPKAGEPTRYRPAQARKDIGFVAMLPADGATGDEADLWGSQTANVLRALSLVPNALREWSIVGDQQYLSPTNMAHFGEFEGRALNRMQIELIAGRVSSYNECFY